MTDRGGELARRAIAEVEAADAAFFRLVPDTDGLLTMLRLVRAPEDDQNGSAERA